MSAPAKVQGIYRHCCELTREICYLRIGSTCPHVRSLHEVSMWTIFPTVMPYVQALDAAEEEEKSAEANFQLLSSKDAPPPPPDIGDNLTITPGEMTVAALQEALSKRGLDTKWNPLKSKKELVDRLQVFVMPHRLILRCSS